MAKSMKVPSGASTKFIDLAKECWVGKGPVFEVPTTFVVTSKLPRKQSTQRFQVPVFVANGDDTTNSLVNSI
jgi:hypothetical protein